MVENHRAVSKIKERFSEDILDIKESCGEVIIVVKKENIVELCKYLRDTLEYNFLVDITAVDYLGKEPRFNVVYQLRSMPNKDMLRIKAVVDENDTSIDSISSLWSTADWLEREVFDLFGITFNGHPDMRRILMADDWEGYPLRKDYPLQGPGREPYKGRLS